MALSTRRLCVLLLVLVGLAAAFSSGNAVLRQDDQGTVATFLGRPGGRHQVLGSATMSHERPADKRQVEEHLNEDMRLTVSRGTSSFRGSSRGGSGSFGGSSRGRSSGSFGGSSRGGSSFGGSRGGSSGSFGGSRGGSSDSFGGSRGGARSSSEGGSPGSGSRYIPYYYHGQGSDHSDSSDYCVGGRGRVWNMGVVASVLAAAWLV